jgi:hypothetical protein
VSGAGVQNRAPKGILAFPDETGAERFNRALQASVDRFDWAAVLTKPARHFAKKGDRRSDNQRKPRRIQKLFESVTDC